MTKNLPVEIFKQEEIFLREDIVEWEMVTLLCDEKTQKENVRIQNQYFCAKHKRVKCRTKTNNGNKGYILDRI